LDGRDFDRLTALFVDDAEHAVEWLSHGLLRPPRQGLSNRVQESYPPFAIRGDDGIADA
jgi:hypothetical protein